MKPRTAKLVLTLATAGAGGLGDLALQLQAGQLISVPRTVLFGMGLGLFARIIGAGLAHLVEQAAVAEASHPDQPE